jgi:histone acetyltransferase 1
MYASAILKRFIWSDLFGAKLYMASGSLRQFVSLSWSAALTGAAIDDPANTLYQYLPKGMYSPDKLETILTSPADRSDDEAAFKKLVEEDAVNFRPLGEKIHSYVRRSGQRAKDPREMPVGKAKELPSEDGEDSVVYEVYHVGVLILHIEGHY